ncbi:colicin V biosynthesis protein [Thalassobaculum fulvum]|uniref:Colicin V biosynthesis protein n=1 Tax=Thalassobaculum fulvum TaxID=1633335 RepID=A0A918XRE7_9PROT|nr:CvpA family protein [Thalassobaculum fulvum]GHD49757.1 colicin V biosynthesis protein [Thalassobaculum fulvum]
MDSLPINITDLIILLVLLLSGLLAFLRGFVQEVLSVASWIGALFVAVYGYVHLQPFARQLVTVNTTIADAAAGLVLFLFALVVFVIVSRFLARTLSMAGLGALDRTLGFLFGLARGAALVCLAYLLILWAVPERKDHPAWLTQARALPLIEEGAEFLWSLVPPHLLDEADVAAARARRQAEEQARRELGERILNPTPKADAPDGSNGYTDKERQEMNRVIQGTQ